MGGTNPWVVLAQYGAIGVILAIFLGMFVRIFHRLVDNLMTQNTAMQKTQTEQLAVMQRIENNISTGFSMLNISIRQLDNDVAMTFNEMTGSRRMRIPTLPDTPSAKARGGSGRGGPPSSQG